MSSISTLDNTAACTFQQDDQTELVVSLRTSGGTKAIASLRLASLVSILQGTLGVALSPPKKQSLEYSEDTKKRLKENRKVGRLMSRSLRLRGATGKDRRPELAIIANEYGRSMSEAEILVRQHNKARDARRERLRVHLLSSWMEDGATIPQMASRLNVSKQHIHRLIKQIRERKGD